MDIIKHILTTFYIKKLSWMKNWRNKQKFKNQIWFCISNLANSWKNGKTQNRTSKVNGDSDNFHAKFKTPKINHKVETRYKVIFPIYYVVASQQLYIIVLTHAHLLPHTHKKQSSFYPKYLLPWVTSSFYQNKWWLPLAKFYFHSSYPYFPILWQ